MKQTKADKSLVILTIAAILLSVISLMASFVAASSVRSRADTNSREAMILRYDYSRLAFCYEFEIHPCDDSGISAWNEQNPDNQFSLQRPSSP
jgi:hypothetical protein